MTRRPGASMTIKRMLGNRHRASTLTPKSASGNLRDAKIARKVCQQFRIDRTLENTNTLVTHYDVENAHRDMMDTQNDSIDIPRLQAFALGLQYESPEKDWSDVASKAATVTIPINNLPEPAQPSPAARSSQNQPAHSSAWPTKQRHPQIDNTKDPRRRQSHSELPSTIPESTRGKMFQDSTPPGDTQPASPWVYEKLAANENEKSSTRATGTPQAHELQQNSSIEGDGGDIDLLAAFEQPSILDPDDEEALADQDDELDPLSQDVRADVYPKYKRFTVPKTPAQQGTKRKRESPESSQQAQTPSLPINPFVKRTGNQEMMDPSQLFKATQALTSPLNIISDGLSERPSPDIQNKQRSSTAESNSSPVKLARANMMRAVTEPQTTYISMKQSQEAREKRLREMELERNLLSDGISDDESDTIDSDLRRKLNRKEIAREVRERFSRVLKQSNQRKGRLRDVTPQLHSSPQRRGRQASEAVVISDDAFAEETPGNITEDETEREEEAEDEDAASEDEFMAEENKENVEVPMTVSRVHHRGLQITSQTTPSHYRTRKATIRQQDDHAILMSSSPGAQNASQRPAAPSQRSAVADSQTSQGQVQSRKMSSSARDPSTASSSAKEPRVLIPQSQLSQASKAPCPPSTPNAVQGKDMGLSVPQSSPAQLGELKASVKVVTNAASNDVSSNLVLDSDDLPNGESLSSKPHNPIPLSQAQIEEPRSAASNIQETRASSGDQNSEHGSVHPDSTVIPSPKSTPKSDSKNYSNPLSVKQSRPSTMYETAQERLTGSPSKSHSSRIQHQTRSKTSSPAKSQRRRTIAEIAADPSPPDEVGDIDVDIQILSNDDIEFQNAVNGSTSLVSNTVRHNAMNTKPPNLPDRRQGLPCAIPTVTTREKQLPKAVRSPPSFKGTPDAPPSSAYSALTPPPPLLPTGTSSPLTASSKTRSRRKGTMQAPGNTSDYVVRRNASTERHEQIPNLQAPTTSATTNTNNAAAPSGVATNAAPNRVFAHFKDGIARFYPATCLGIIPGPEPRYRVRFDDGTIDVLGAYGIKRLELRNGDIIKVDLPELRTKNFVVEGAQDQQHLPDPDTPSRIRARPIGGSTSGETDVHGHATVLVSAKQRQSTGPEQSSSPQIRVPMGSVYLTQTMWAALKDREYSHPLNFNLSSTGLQTPSERPSTPSTPSSRTRRQKSTVPQSRAVAPKANSSKGIFNNMVFTVTNISRAEDLQRTNTQILSNGGRILEDGFDDLFHTPSLSRSTTPTESKEPSFHLLPSSLHIGFTCLIADKHCRRAKYIQALALGIPCLSARWISDCVKHQRLLPCAPYLLPAGESTYLNGAVRSRVLDPLPSETTSTLASLVDARPRMLDSASILLIMQKGEEAKMKHHNFLTHALGAVKVAKATSADGAARAVTDALAQGEKWDWVYTHEGGKETEKVILGGLGGKRGRKRKRTEDGEWGTRVVGNEFVMQSLILGRLAE